MFDNKVDVLGEGVYDFSTVACVYDDELKSFAARTPALYELHKVLRCKILSKQRQSTGVSMTGEMQDCRVVEPQGPRQVSGAGEVAGFENYIVSPRCSSALLEESILHLLHLAFEVKLSLVGIVGSHKQNAVWRHMSHHRRQWGWQSCPI